MPRKGFTKELSSAALAYVLLIGLLPMSNDMLSMRTSAGQATDLALAAQSSALQNYATEKNAGESSSVPCCDSMGSFSMACAFIIPQFSNSTARGGSDRIGFAVPVYRSINIEAVSPPPKA